MDVAPSPNVWPTVKARDAVGLIAFLEEALGFETVVVHGDGDWVDHAELAWPLGGGVMIGSVRAEEDGDDAFGRRCSLSAYVVTDDPDALCARAKAAGADITLPLHDTDYGSRDFSLRDPEGNRWSFGTYPGSGRPAD
jgi:uncharacterized glyoxalase superfamily protein PhnB